VVLNNVILSTPTVCVVLVIINILRRIFGPVQNEDGSWRIRMNYELNELIVNADIARFIKCRRID
jgi:hypothetical protein